MYNLVVSASFNGVYYCIFNEVYKQYGFLDNFHLGLIDKITFGVSNIYIIPVDETLYHRAPKRISSSENNSAAIHFWAKENNINVVYVNKKQLAKLDIIDEECLPLVKEDNIAYKHYSMISGAIKLISLEEEEVFVLELSE